MKKGKKFVGVFFDSLKLITELYSSNKPGFVNRNISSNANRDINSNINRELDGIKIIERRLRK